MAVSPVKLLLLITLPSMGFQSNVIHMIKTMGPVGKLVMGLLLFFSITSWAIIIEKLLTFYRLKNYRERFLKVVRKFGLHRDSYEYARKFKKSPEAQIFLSVWELMPSPNPSVSKIEPIRHSLENVQKTLEIRATEIISNYEKRLMFLATTGSVTPFIGLFGTVWGIMNSFSSIGQMGTANIATVAPGISEALINTAAGLFCAIPAVIAYNFFVQKTRKVAQNLANFITELVMNLYS